MSQPPHFLLTLIFLQVVLRLTTGAPSEADTTKVTITCPETSPNLNSTITFTYTPSVNETVNTIFLYDANCSNPLSLSREGAAFSGGIGGDCVSETLVGVFRATVAVQYGTVFRASDHLYEFECVYAASQNVTSSVGVAGTSWSQDQQGKVSQTQASGAALSENFTVTFTSNESDVGSSVKLGQLISLNVELANTSVYHGFFIAGIEATGIRPDQRIQLTQDASGCASRDALDNDIDLKMQTIEPKKKTTQAFQAFTFQNERTVKFRMKIFFCAGPGEKCTSQGNCSTPTTTSLKNTVAAAVTSVTPTPGNVTTTGSANTTNPLTTASVNTTNSGLRRRKRSEDEQEGGLVTELQVELASEEDNHVLFVPEVTRKTCVGAIPGVSCAVAYFLYGAVAVLVLTLIVAAVVITRRYKSKSRRDDVVTLSSKNL